MVFYERQPHASLKVAVLPPGKDPDLLIRESPEEWERLVAEAKPLMDYLFDIMASRLDSSSGQDKLQATEALFPFHNLHGKPLRPGPVLPASWRS